MRRMTGISSGRQHERRASVNLLFALLSIGFLVLPASAQQKSLSAPEKLSQLERTIIGSDNCKTPIEKRLKDLEVKVFDKVQTGSLSSRISALEKFAGITRTDYMPPLPPLFDNGKPPLKVAPDLKLKKVLPAVAPQHNAAEMAKEQTTGSAAEFRTNSNSDLKEAIKLHQQGNDPEAERSLKIILTQDPKNGDACFSLGAIAEARGDVKTALEYYTLAMQANPNDSEASSAVAELSGKIKAANNSNAPFVNPLDSAVQRIPPNVLQGHALSVNAQSTLGNNLLVGRNTSVGRTCVPTAAVNQPVHNSSFARSVARAALGVALSGTGLHCPVCHLIRGF